MLVLGENDVKHLLHLGELMPALEKAFQHGPRAFAMPARQQMDAAGGVHLLMPCCDPAAPALGFKSVFVAQNPAPDRQRVEATYFLLDPAAGGILAMLSANYLTDIRTAAVSALATRHMAKRKFKVLSIFGTGRQARAHLEVFASLFKFEAVLICGSTPHRATAFVAKMKKQVTVPLRAADARACAAEADVICTCTSATAPLFDGREIKPGAHLNLIGTFRPGDREVDGATVERARVVVDTYEGGLSEPGDLIVPLREEIITRSHIIADLHEIVSGKVRARSSDDEITLFKSVGCAMEDLVAALLVFEAANARGKKKPKVHSA